MPNWSGIKVKPRTSKFICYCSDLSDAVSAVLKFSSVIVWLPKSLNGSLRTRVVNLGAPVLGRYIFRRVMSSCWIEPFIIM